MSTRILIIGTTPDYIEWLRSTAPTRGLFLTLPEIRATARAHESPPPLSEEILTALDDVDEAASKIVGHCQRYQITISGITCFDCEHLLFTAQLAQKLSLLYSSPTAVQNCRDKYAAKILWQKNNVLCPRVTIVETAENLREWLEKNNLNECVLKPISGAGSELTFHCKNADDAVVKFAEIKTGLQNRRDEKLFADSRIIAEEYISADEYSADFVIVADMVKIIRVCRKYKSCFGITNAYELLTPPEIATLKINESIKNAAHALGLTNTIAMADFFVQENRAVFLEITPRLGGDCLPWLLKYAGDFDCLKFALDFSCGDISPLPIINKTAVALRIFADRAGQIKKFIPHDANNDTRVKQIYCRREIGDMIKLPPDDWHTWILGHLIYEPHPAQNIPTQNNELRNKFKCELV